jgi:hypothetical protein
MMNPKSRITFGTLDNSIFSLLLAIALALSANLLIPNTAKAIGPNDQVIPDAPNPLNLGATGILSGAAGANANSGTGTVIGATINNGTGYVAVLTASHVGSTLQNLQLGSGLGNPQSYTLNFTGLTFRPYMIPNPDNYIEDVGVVLDSINLNGNPQAANAFNLLMNNLPTVTNPAKGGNPLVLPNSGSLSVSMTQLGYGISGQYNPKIIDGNLTNRGPGYQTDGTFGKRGFQNNTALSYASPAVVMTTGGTNYYEPINTDQVLDQSNAGGGGGFPGDSGSPWFTGGAASAATITRAGNQLVIPIDQTNNISAVFVAGKPAQFVNLGNDQLENIDPLTILVGSTQYAVPIDQGSIISCSRTLLIRR